MSHKLKIAGWISVGALAGALTTVSLQTVARAGLAPLPLEELQQLAAVFGMIKSDYVEAIDDKGDYRNFLNLNTVVISPKGDRQTVRLEQTGPGHYEARFPTIVERCGFDWMKANATQSVPLGGAEIVTVKLVTVFASKVVAGHVTMLLAPSVPPPLALTKVAFVGRKSCAMTLLASDGPKFDTMIE